MTILLFLCIPGCRSIKVYSTEPLIIGDEPGEVFEIDSKTEFYHTGGIMVTGEGKLVVKGTLYQTGNVYITENGTFMVDGGEFHIDGHDTNVYVDKNGSCIFQNNALLHYVQHYVSQHNLIGMDNSQFEFKNSRIDCDGSVEFVHLVDNASYRAYNTTFTDWTTWYLYDETSLFLEQVNYAGDIVIYDSPTMHFKDTQFLMPWLYLGDGAFMDFQFPAEPTVNITIDSTSEGVSGIPWTLTMETCSHIAWGVNPYPGSDVTVRDSHLTMVLFRFAGEGTFDLQGIMQNNSYYKDVTIPVKDRNFRLVNTSVKWWKVDVVDDFQLYADSLVFSEMVLKDNGRAYLTNSICEGQTIHVGAKDNSFLYFEKGEVWSYVSVWGNAVMVLSDSLVDWEKGEFIYQKLNIAHGNSRLYCLNSVLKSKPEAYDSALVVFASLTGPDTGNISEEISVSGSAWIDTGPESGVTFSRYQLWWTKNGSDWVLIERSEKEVEDSILGVWNTEGLAPGEYNLQLMIWVDNSGSDNPPDAYPVYRKITLTRKTDRGKWQRRIERI